MKLVGTIALWLLSVAVLLATIGGGLFLYLIIASSHYPEHWVASVSVIAGLLLTLWLNPLVRHLLKQRGRVARGWLVALGLLLLVPAGVVASNFLLGNSPRWLIDQGTSVRETDPRAAAAFFKRACQANSGEGCVELGSVYDPGLYRGPLPNAAEAQNAYQRACDLGNPNGCVGLELILDRSDANAEPRSRALLIRACDLKTSGWGNEVGVESCLMAGGIFLRGDGVPRDLSKAQTYFERACPTSASVTDHAPDACRTAALALRDISVLLAPTDARRAAELANTALRQAQLACNEPGHPSALMSCGAYGAILARGVVSGAVVLLAPDVQAANAPLATACRDHLDIDACSLIVRLPTGNSRESVATRSAECSNGETLSCKMAGRAYEFGVGVAPDVSRAAQFYAEACEQIERGRSRLYGGDECYPGAMFALEGIGRDAPNLAEARSRLTIACQDESYEAQAACVQLGDMLRDGRGGPSDRAGAITAYRRAMQLDSTVRFAEYARGRLQLLAPGLH